MTADQQPQVLSLASTYPRWQGDTEPAFVHHLNRELQASIRTTALAPHAPRAARQEEIDGVPVLRFRYAPEPLERLAYDGGMLANVRGAAWKWLLLPTFLLAQVFAIRKAVRSRKVDVIHAHWLIPQGLAAVLALASLRGRKPRLLCTSHGGDLYSLDGKAGRWLKRWIIRRCDALTVVSHAMQEDAGELFGELPPTRVIPMGTDAARLFTPVPAEQRSPERLLFVGRLVEKKGAGFLLEAFARLHARSTRLRLEIVGDGPLRAELEQQAQELGIAAAVDFAGALPHAEVARRMQTCGLFIMPAVRAESGDQEGFGLVITEALACGCTVVASDLPPIRDIIIDGETGIMAEPGNSSELARKMEQLLRDPARSAELGNRGRKHVENNFDWSVVARRYSEFLQQLARPLA